MRKLAIGAVALTMLSVASTAEAGPRGRTLTGVAIGAGTGAVVAGPIGAVAGGVIGAVVGGPRIHRHKHCWHDRRGRRHCKWY